MERIKIKVRNKVVDPNHYRFEFVGTTQAGVEYPPEFDDNAPEDEKVIKVRTEDDMIEVQKNLIKRMLGECYSKQEIIDVVMDAYKISEACAKLRFKEAVAEYIMSEEFEEFRRINIGRLDTIVRRAYEENNYQAALKAIDIQNKMVDGYSPIKIEMDGQIAIF